MWTDPARRLLGANERGKALMRAVDRLNAEYGRDAVSLAASGRRPGWGLRSERRSPHYSTDWDELLRVA